MIIKPYIKDRWDSIYPFLEIEEINFLYKQKAIMEDKKELFEFVFYCYMFPALMDKTMEGGLSDYYEFFPTIPQELYKSYILLEDKIRIAFIDNMIEYIFENIGIERKYKDEWDARVYMIAREDVGRYSSKQKKLFNSLKNISSEMIDDAEPFFEERVEFIYKLCMKGDYYPEFFKKYYLLMYQTRFEHKINSKKKGMFHFVKKLLSR